MNIYDKNKVKKLIRKNGDGFWNETQELSNGKRDIQTGNWHLFDEIVSAVNDGGYDLVLVKKGGNCDNCGHNICVNEKGRYIVKCNKCSCENPL